LRAWLDCDDLKYREENDAQNHPQPGEHMKAESITASGSLDLAAGEPLRGFRARSENR
jgi:hypothetical protein